MKQNPKTLEEKIDKFNCKNVRSGHEKHSTGKNKRQVTDCAKIFADSIKGISLTYEKLIKIHKRKIK